jgi:hypothetical protein
MGYGIQAEETAAGPGERQEVYEQEEEMKHKKPKPTVRDMLANNPWVLAMKRQPFGLAVHKKPASWVTAFDRKKRKPWNARSD